MTTKPIMIPNIPSKIEDFDTVREVFTKFQKFCEDMNKEDKLPATTLADATLSGTAVVFEIKDKSGNTYYFKGYPTIS